MKRVMWIPVSLAAVTALAVFGVPSAVADDDRVIKQTEEIIREPAPQVQAPAASGTVVVPSQGAMTYSGVVTEVNPTSQVIIVKSPKPEAAPVTYTITPNTVFLDAAGNTVTYQAIENAPVKIEYSMENGRTVVRRVIQTGPAVQVR